MFGHARYNYNSKSMLPKGPAISEEDYSHLNSLVGFRIGHLGLQTSGSGAITRACRLARAITGKNRIVVVGDFWHGSDGEFLFRHNKEKISTGIPNEHMSNVRWIASTEDFEEILEAEDIAAILVEPYQGSDPSKNMLESISGDVRQRLRDKRILLIADEIITGFKEQYGSCSISRMANPDIVVLGKAAALGYPVGLVLVSSESFFSDDDVEMCRPFWGGTFSASPEQLVRLFSSLRCLRDFNYNLYNTSLEGIVNYIEDSCELFGIGYELRRGKLFARIREIADSSTARSFMSKRAAAGARSRLEETLEKSGLHVASNGLVFGSCYDPYKYL